jgi:hypothetical protein
MKLPPNFPGSSPPREMILGARIGFFLHARVFPERTKSAPLFAAVRFRRYFGIAILE